MYRKEVHTSEHPAEVQDVYINTHIANIEDDLDLSRENIDTHTKLRQRTSLISTETLLDDPGKCYM